MLSARMSLGAQNCKYFRQLNIIKYLRHKHSHTHTHKHTHVHGEQCEWRRVGELALNNVLMRLTKFKLHTCRRQRTAFIKCSKINNKQTATNKPTTRKRNKNNFKHEFLMPYNVTLYKFKYINKTIS